MATTNEHRDKAYNNLKANIGEIEYISSYNITRACFEHIALTTITINDPVNCYVGVYSDRKDVKAEFKKMSKEAFTKTLFSEARILRKLKEIRSGNN